MQVPFNKAEAHIPVIFWVLPCELSHSDFKEGLAVKSAKLAMKWLRCSYMNLEVHLLQAKCAKNAKETNMFD